MTWTSDKYKGRWDELDYFYQPNEKKMNTKHNWKMIGGLILIAVIGALQALKGVAGLSAYIEAILPIAVIFEHILNGNTSTPTP